MTRFTALSGWFISFGVCTATIAAPLASQQDLRAYGRLAVDYSKTPYILDSERQVQNFVWRHWNQRRRGYVVFTIRTLEGDVATTHLFIEPAKQGYWHVRGIVYGFYSDRFLRNNVPKRPDTHAVTKFEAVSVDWVFDHDRKFLALKGRSGKVIDPL